MNAEGGCYCGNVRYKVEGEPLFKGQCYCRECQYISGGGPNLVLGMPAAGFAYTKGSAKPFQRSDLESPATREFCPDCGTHLVSKAPGLPGAVMLKVGSLDNPAEFGGAQMAIFTVDEQDFHQLPDGVPAFERMPG